MRLSSLSLAGFKSFADPTTLEFHAGVTAIIGPNGSGKSNVIDALRWAGSGGRASDFRAGEKTDLIFHGSATKRSLGYAEVEILLRQEARSVSIVRSLHRDGSSKLKLNGKTARFMDIDEELAGSGLGRGGLAIIGQGEVSGVLMADPPKLLSYVEEAAGVSRLSHRRDSTLMRLATASEHLERLGDILRELERQVAQLTKQAAQAERQTELTRERLALRYTLTFRRVEGLEEEVSGLGKQAEVLRSQLEAGKARLEGAQADWQTSRRVLAEGEERYRAKLAEAEARRGDVRVAQERLNAAEGGHAARLRERQGLEEELVRLRALPLPTPPEGDTGALEEAVEGAQGTLAEQQSRLKNAEGEAALLQAELATLRRQVTQAEAARAAYESRKGGLEVSLADMVTRLQSLADSPRADTEVLEQRATEAAQTLATSRTALERARHDLVTLQTAHANAAAEGAALERAAVRTRSAYESRQGYAQGPKNALTSGIKGVLGSVADLLTVPPDYAQAFSSALGRRAENVVVDTSDTAQRVLAAVKRAGGYVTLLPLDLIDGRTQSLAPALAREEAVLGLLSDLVRYDPRYGGIVRQLLGSTALLRSLEEATLLAKRYAQRPRFVTLEGDLIESYGAISGGRRTGVSPILGLAAELEAAEQGAEGARTQAQTTLAELQGAQVAAKTIQEEGSTLERHLKEAESALRRAREEAASHEALRGELERRRSTLETELAALAEPAPAPAADLTALEERLATHQTATNTLRVALSGAAEQLSSLRGELTLVRERHESYRGALARYEEGQKRRETLEARALSLDLSVTEHAVTEARAALARANAALPNDLEAEEARYREAQAAAASAEKTLNSLSATQASEAATLNDLELTFARRDAARELAREELTAFPAGLEPLDAPLKTLRSRLSEVEAELETLGPVNHRAAQEVVTERQRLTELQAQSAEGAAAVGELESILGELDHEITLRLNAALEALGEGFMRHVRQLFGEASEAEVETLREEGRPVGLRIALQPAGKRTRSLNLLSVGERTMGAMAFLFALMGEGGTLPIAILDEVDAPLDEANIRRFCTFLKERAEGGTQFVLITHQKATMETADVLWGVTTEGGVSRVFSIARPQAEAAD